nr:MAG TPA: hypothetical protein [Caudoviricetes sp.]
MKLHAGQFQSFINSFSLIGSVLIMLVASPERLPFTH